MFGSLHGSNALIASVFFVDMDGRKAHCNLSQVIPDTLKSRDGEIKPLLADMEQLVSNSPVGIFVMEMLYTFDERGKLLIFHAARAKGLEGISWQGVFEVVGSEDLTNDVKYSVDVLISILRARRQTRICIKRDIQTKSVQILRIVY